MGLSGRVVPTLAGGLLLAAGLVATAGTMTVTSAGGSAVPRASATPDRSHTSVGATSSGAVAMWAWNWSNAAELVRFATHHDVSTVFAYVAPGFTTPTYVPPGWSTPEWPLITALVTDAATAGITVYAMDGDPSWVTHPTVAAAWAKEALGTGLFSGVHLEIEPWGLGTWTTDRAATIAAFLTSLAAVHAVAEAYGVVDEISIPWWLYQYSDANGTALDVAAMRNADAVTIVTYFNTVGQIESSGETEQASAQALGLPFRFAAECSDVTPSWLTFYGTPAHQFDSALAQVNHDMAGVAGYAGIAVEDYAAWAALPTTGEPG